MIVRLDTDAGVSGYGEMMMLSMGFRWPVMTTMIEDLVDSAVIGHDPYNTEQLFDKVYGRAGCSHAPEQTRLAILGALDMACWDIIGKDVAQPVHRLLGGRMRDRVRTYTYLYADNLGRSLRDLWLDPAHAAQRARHYIDLGFTAVKLDPFVLNITEDQALGQIVPLDPWNLNPDHHRRTAHVQVRLRRAARAPRGVDLQLRRRHGRRNQRGSEDRHDGRAALRAGSSACVRRPDDHRGLDPTLAGLPELPDHGGH